MVRRNPGDGVWLCLLKTPSATFYKDLRTLPSRPNCTTWWNTSLGRWSCGGTGRSYQRKRPRRMPRPMFRVT